MSNNTAGLFTLTNSSHLGDCPICFLPLPINVSNVFMPCCSKKICIGCDYANTKREIAVGLEPRCAFCREPAAKSQEEAVKRCMERIKKNCPAAMCHMGKRCYHEGDYDTGLQYLMKAAELGDVDAHHELSVIYRKGEGVEANEKKKVFHMEEAAIRGHAQARHNLGCDEADNGNFDKARKHFIIAANLGNQESLKCIRKLYAKGHATKEEYADALRAYQAAVDATKSPQRKEGGAYFNALYLPLEVRLRLEMQGSTTKRT